MTTPRANTTPPPTPRNAPRRAFTLVELLAVIGIIALLITLVVGGGIALLRNSRASVTQNVLISLDRALDEYMISNAGNPPTYDPESYDDVPGAALTSDDRFGRNEFANSFAFPTYPEGGREHPRFPDAAVFLQQARGYGAVDDIIAGLPERFVFLTRRGSEDEDIGADTTPSIVDAWGVEGWNAPWPILEQQVIYYIHPNNLVAQALYGRCQSRRPYFMSAGPDMKYGHGFEVVGLETSAQPGKPADIAEAEAFLEDNIYSTPGVAGTHEPDLDLRVEQP